MSDIARAAMEAARTAAKARTRRFRRARPRRSWSGPGPSAQDPQLLGQLAAALVTALSHPEERAERRQEGRSDRQESLGAREEVRRAADRPAHRACSARCACVSGVSDRAGMPGRGVDHPAASATAADPGTVYRGESRPAAIVASRGRGGA